MGTGNQTPLQAGAREKTLPLQKSFPSTGSKVFYLGVKEGSLLDGKEGNEVLLRESELGERKRARSF